jgi:AraC family transcriptional regulator
MNRVCSVDYRMRLVRVMNYIDANLDRDLPLEELAAEACFSAFHFHRVFRSMLGMTVAGYVRRRKLVRAARRLADTGDSVVDIALEAGYGAHESFTRAFRTMYGLSPSEFREQSRLKPVVSPDALELIPLLPPGGIDMEISIKTFEPTRVACVRHVGPYAACEPAWQKLCGWAGQKGLLGPDTLAIGISYDEPSSTPAELLRFDACVSVPDSVQGEGEVGIKIIPGGKYAVAVHVGSYSGLEQAYKELYGGWLPEQGLKPRDEPAFEIYRNDPSFTPAEKLITEICVPLE